MGAPPPDLGWGVPIEERMRVELLGARWSRWLDRVGRSWSVREDGVALEGSQRWRDRKHCLLHTLPRDKLEIISSANAFKCIVLSTAICIIGASPDKVGIFSSDILLFNTYVFCHIFWQPFQ